jgi:hypothetical protein
MSISQKLNLQPAVQNLSQVNIISYINLIKSTKKWLDKYLLHCEFAQNALEVRDKSLCDYLSVSQNNFKFLSASGNPGLSACKSYHRHLVILRWPPKPPSRTEMDALPGREDSGEGLPQDGNGKHGKPGKHGRLRGFGARRTWMALVRLQGIAFPLPHGWSRCRVPLQNMRSGPIGSGGGDPVRSAYIWARRIPL